MNSRGVKFYSEQLSQLKSELAEERAKIAPEEKESTAVSRLDQTEINIRDAEYYHELVVGGSDISTPELIRGLISAQVELDYLRSPEVDPIVGWINSWNVRHADGETYTVVDSQLYRAFLDHKTPSLVSFQYKPRKLDIVAGVWEDGGTLSFSQQLFEPSSKDPLTADTAKRLIVKNGFDSLTENPKTDVTIKTKDLIRLHLSSKINKSSIKETRAFVFKAGVGAHLSNATTGFSMEHWLESDTPVPTQMMCLQMNLSLPTRSINLISSKVLTAFGGVSETVNHLNSGLFVKSVDEPAGVHGVRIIDGLGSLVIDVRTAKPLNALSLTPDYSDIVEESGEQTVVGLILQFFIDARRILGDDKANTTFVSIT